MTGQATAPPGKESMMTSLLLFVGLMTLLAILSLRFGADSRRFDDRATSWW